MRKIEQYIEKKENTEYNNSITSQTSILIDDNIFSSTNAYFINVNPYFDLETDLKLGSKSLTLKYLESKLKDIEYKDEFATILGLLEALGDDYINDVNLLHDQTKIIFDLSDFTLKKLIKLLEPKIIKNDFDASVYDLSYYEMIKFQIDLVKELSNDSDKYIFINIDVDIDSNLLNYIIETLTNDNIFCFILSNNKHTPLNIEKYLILNNQFIDMANEVDVYNNIIMNLPYHVDIPELSKIFTDYICGRRTIETVELEKII